MKCDDILKQINEYIDGEIDPALCRDLEKHLKDCCPCRIVVDTIRKTISVFREGGEPCTLPDEFRSRLHARLKADWSLGKTH